MGIFKNDVGRPSNETIKKRNIFKGICVLLVIIIISLVCYILNDKGIITFNKHEQNKNDNDKIVTTTKKENIIEISKSEALRIYEGVLGTFMFDTEDLLYLNNDTFKTAFCLATHMEESNKYNSFELLKNKLKKENDYYIYGFEDGTSIIYNNNAKVYEYNNLNKEIKNIFGDVEAVKEDLEFYQYRYVYIEDKNVYVRLESVWGDGGHQVIADVASASKIKDKVNIDILIADVEYIDENQYLYFSSDGDEIKLNNEDIKNYSETLKKYENKVKKYTLTFVENNDKYLFESIK